MNDSVGSRTRVCTSADSPRRRWSRRLKIVVGVVFVGYLLVLGEIACRAYWYFNRGVPFLHPSAIWHAFYPEVKQSGVDKVAVRNDDDVFDVLLLGGSVVSEGFGSIAPRLGEGLKAKLGREVRVFNLAFAGKTSRDSLLKYRALEDKHFDLVIFYHGINDTRMNDCPPKLFRDDYQHCAWYHKIDLYRRHPEAKLIVLPYTMSYLAVNVVDGLRLGCYIPRLNPSPAWVEFGRDIKTARPFRANLDEIVTTARKKGERMLVMTFAYHVPPDDTKERSLAQKLDCHRPKTAIEIWGKSEYVTKGMDVHNAIVREVARDNPEVLFVDQAALMTKDVSCFIDCCHFTEEGCAEFVGHIMDGVGDRLQ